MVPSFRFYTKTEETWQSMLEALREAKISIDIEHYIFAADLLGAKFLEVLKKKNKEGVKIRMLLDAVGSYSLYNSEIPEELYKLGIEVRFFNPISPWRVHNFTSWFFRNHKKVIVVDRNIGFTGGSGIRDDMRDWRDTNARTEGDTAEEMSDSFEEVWEQSANKNIARRIRKVRAQVRRRYFITNAPYFRKRFLYYTFIEALRNAQKTIYLTTPYFIPDRRLQRVLRLAVRRGVDVKIIVPTIFDVPIVATASDSFFNELLRGGVQIFQYQPVFLHAKTAIVDGEWATFGSFNLDSLSFIYNFEGNIVSTDRDCALELTKHFLDDLGNSVEVRLENWVKRPLLEKVQEFFVGPIRGFL